MKKHVLVLASPGHPDLPTLDVIRDRAHIQVADSPEQARSAVGQVEIVFALQFDKHWLLQDIWPGASSVRWVQSSYAGVESLMFPELLESQVVLTNARGLYSRVLAEFVVAAILYFAKRLDELRSNQRAGIWSRLQVEEVWGGTVGIVGVGDVGRACAGQVQALGMRLLGCKRNPDTMPEIHPFERMVSPDRLLEILPECDWVVLATPLTTRTGGMIGEPELRAMKPNSVLINIGRGATIREPALIRALQEGWIRGAALDVVDPEPLPAHSPLWGMDNVLLTAHSADHTSDDLVQAGRLFVGNFRRYVDGKPLLNMVNKQAGY